MRDISLLNEFQSMNFSKKKQLKNKQDGLEAGTVTSFDFSQFRERDWSNVLTCHQSKSNSGASESPSPQLWSYANHSISKLAVQHKVGDQSRVTSVGVTLCGNFGVLGFQNGMISKFNMQSGIDRGLFTVEKGVSSDSMTSGLHTGEVTGLGIDSLNKFLVSCSLDKTIKLWDFYRGKLLRTFFSEYPVDNLTYNRVNDLVAFSSSDLSLTLLNVKTGLKKVRHFEGAAQNKITDICFSQPDSKWVLCSSMDKCIRVWDIITGQLIDWIQF